MTIRISALLVTAIGALCACGGGAGGYGTPSTAPAMPVATPLAAPASGLQTASFSTATRGAQTGFKTMNGLAAYDFDLDLTTPNTSSCITACAAFWPPILVPPASSFSLPFGTVRRPEGTFQLAYNGHPLYNYSQDSNATLAAGDGLNVSGGLWHLAQAASLTTPLGTPTSVP